MGTIFLVEFTTYLLFVSFQEYIEDLIPELFTIALEHTCFGQIDTYIKRHCVTIDD